MCVFAKKSYNSANTKGNYFKKVALVAEEFFPLKQILEEEIEENKIDPLR